MEIGEYFYFLLSFPFHFLLLLLFIFRVLKMKLFFALFMYHLICTACDVVQPFEWSTTLYDGAQQPLRMMYSAGPLSLSPARELTTAWNISRSIEVSDDYVYQRAVAVVESPSYEIYSMFENKLEVILC